MAYTYGSRQKSSKVKLLLLFIVFVILIVGAYLFFKDETVVAPNNAEKSSSNNPEQPVVNVVVADKFNSEKLQAVLDQWQASHSGSYGVVLTDKDSKVLASIDPDQEFFTASIYKLFVAYEAYLKVDSGEYSLDEVYAAGVPLKTCLDEMIRLSVSVTAQNCSETLWTKQGKQAATARLQEKFGLKNTDMVGLSTSAGDTAVILSRLEGAKDLSESSRDLMLESMKNQIHRKGLPAGITTATVYEKVGFNEDLEYHDAAILRFPDGRSLVVSLFTKSAGTKNVSGLARAIEQSVLDN